MSIWKHTFRGVFILGNLVVGTGFLCCAYSPLLSPVAHPVLACAGLFFPFFLLALIVLAVVGLFHGWKFMCYHESIFQYKEPLFLGKYHTKYHTKKGLFFLYFQGIIHDVYNLLVKKYNKK